MDAVIHWSSLSPAMLPIDLTILRPARSNHDGVKLFHHLNYIPPLIVVEHIDVRKLSMYQNNHTHATS